MSDVLGIFMSRTDSPAFPISTNTIHFDAQCGDFAWYMASSGAQSDSYPFPFTIAAGNVTWIHYAQVSDAVSTNNHGRHHSVRDASGNRIMVFDMNGGGNVRLQVEGSTTSYSGAINVIQALTRYDIRIDMTSGINVKVYINGNTTALWDITVADAGTRTKPATFTIDLNDGESIWVSEIYVADFDTRNTRPAKQLPNAVGNHTDWTGGYSELGDEDLFTSADGASNGQKVSVNMETYPGPATLGGINRVIMKTIVSKGSVGPQNVAPFLRIGGVDYAGSNLTVTEAPLTQYTEWAVNPATSAEWGSAALDTTEFGLEAKT